MDTVDRLKFRVKGKKEMSEFDKRRLVQKEMKNLKFDENTFYEDNPTWFAFETRLRDMILAFVDPLLKQVLTNDTFVTKVIQNQEYQKLKVDEFEYIVHKCLKNQAKTDENESKILEMEAIMNKRQKDLEAKFKDTNALCKMVNEQAQ